MRTALKAQDANTAHRQVHSKSVNSTSVPSGNAANREPVASGANSHGASVSTAANMSATVERQEYQTAAAAAAAAVYIDDERDSLRAWRARWRQIMQAAIIYFDDIPTVQVEKLKGYLTLLGSTTQPFYDQKVTHVISENQNNELAGKARDHGCKVYTVQKLSRFLGSLLGRSLTTAVDDGHSNRLAQLLEDDSRMSSVAHTRRDDFTTFRGPYLLISDAQGYHRPLIIKEWRTPNELDDSEWPQLRRTPLGVSPFTAKSTLKSDKRKYHDQQVQVQLQQQQRQQQRQQQHQALARLVEQQEEEGDNGAADEGGEQAPPRERPFQQQAAMEAVLLVADEEPMVKRRQLASPMNAADKENYKAVPHNHSQQQHHIPAQSTNSTRLRDFGEIVASGVPRYSQTSNKSFSARDGVTSREMANLRRKVTGSQVVTARNASLIDAGVTSRPVRRPQAKAKPLNKKPGYCENCLERYDDLQSHLKSRTHQQFAGNESKFTGLDLIIERLQRPHYNLVGEGS